MPSSWRHSYASSVGRPSTTGLDHQHLEAEVASDVSAAGLALMLAAPGRPVQAVGDGAFAAVNEVEESTGFGEGERE